MKKLGWMIISFIIGGFDGFLWTMSYYKSNYFLSALGLTIALFDVLAIVMILNSFGIYNERRYRKNIG